MEIDLQHIATLARLKIPQEKFEKFNRDFIDIIQMVENLPDVQGDGTLLDPEHPMTLRRDEVKNEYRRDELLQNAPEVQAGCVVVPRVVE